MKLQMQKVCVNKILLRFQVVRGGYLEKTVMLKEGMAPMTIK